MERATVRLTARVPGRDVGDVLEVEWDHLWQRRVVNGVATLVDGPWAVDATSGHGPAVELPEGPAGHEAPSDGVEGHVGHDSASVDEGGALEDQTVAELRVKAAALGIDAAGLRKAELVEAIRRAAESDPEPRPSPLGDL